MKHVLTVLLLLSASAFAQLAPPPFTKATEGAFYLNIDDSARVLVNGAEVHFNEKAGKFQSKEVGLKPGDHVVVQLKNLRNPKYFMMAFGSTDKKVAVSFTHTTFKQLPALDAKDFTAEEFARISKYAKADTTRKRDGSIPFKHNSEYLWGEFDECTLACVVTSQMFSQIRD